MLRRLERLLHLVGDAFAVGGGVVDHRDDLGLAVGGEVARDRRALLVVAADDAELGLEALLGELRVGRRAGDHRNAGAGCRSARRGSRCPEFRWPTTPATFCVDQLLRNRGADLGIGLVVLGDKRELRLLAADLDLRRRSPLRSRGARRSRCPCRGGRCRRSAAPTWPIFTSSVCAHEREGSAERGDEQRDAQIGVLHGASSDGANIIPPPLVIAITAGRVYFCDRTHFTRALDVGVGHGGVRRHRHLAPDARSPPFFTLSNSLASAPCRRGTSRATSL